jgi:hypothetical protein
MIKNEHRLGLKIIRLVEPSYQKPNHLNYIERSQEVCVPILNREHFIGRLGEEPESNNPQ